MNWRSIAVWTLVVLGSILTLGSLLNAWAERQILSTSGWTQTSDTTASFTTTISW